MDAARSDLESARSPLFDESLRVKALDFSGKSVVVTGAASGIGLSVAAHFAGAGAAVLLVDRNESDLERATALPEFQGKKAARFCADITDTQDCADLAVKAAQLFDRKVHILVNAAGVLPRDNGSASVDEERWRQTIGVNLEGTARVTRYLVEYLKNATPASIVNIASVQGFVHIPNSDAYTASKHAIVGLTKAWAKDFGALGIRCNAVAPGAIHTPMVEAALSDASRRESLLKRTPLGRLGQPHDVAKPILVLASEELSAHITGAVIPVDGGYLST